MNYWIDIVDIENEAPDNDKFLSTETDICQFIAGALPNALPNANVNKEALESNMKPEEPNNNAAANKASEATITSTVVSPEPNETEEPKPKEGLIEKALKTINKSISSFTNIGSNKSKEEEPPDRADVHLTRFQLQELHCGH